MYILLSIITCGIYGYYFVYMLAKDINEMCRDDGQTTPGLAEFILFSIITCGLYSIYWFYKIANRLQANAPKYGLSFQENGTTFLLWYIVGVVLCFVGSYYAIYLIIKNTNAMATAYDQQNGIL